MEETFDSIIICILVRFQELSNWARNVKISPSLDIEKWREAHLAKMILSLDSIICLLQKKDYVSSGALLRVLFDNWYTLIFIYEHTPEREKDLRFLLFYIDGINQRAKSLDALRISPNERVECKDELAAKEAAISKIRQLPIYFEKGEIINKLIDKQDSWRYQSLSSKFNYYQWGDIYDLLSDESTKPFLNFLSQYVHGLYCSNLVAETSENDFIPLAKEVLSLECSLLCYIKESGL